VRENDLIRWIGEQSRNAFPPAWVGPGDDCAVVTLGDERLLVTTDQVLDGVHVDSRRHSPAEVGRKALARGVSDIAAMAALPLCATATAAVPRESNDAFVQGIYRGLRGAADELACPLVGGDLAAWDQRLAVSVTIIGRPDGIEPVLRHGAQAGDALCVTGALGGAWQHGRDLTFTPRIAQARQLADTVDLHAMIDLSDGLAIDLKRLCAAGGVGAEVLADAVPIHPDAADLAAALGDGEDYELLFALPEAQAERLVADQPLDMAVHRIGRIASATDVLLIGLDGSRQPMPDRGWEHGR